MWPGMRKRADLRRLTTLRSQSVDIHWTFPSKPARPRHARGFLCGRKTPGKREQEITANQASYKYRHIRKEPNFISSRFQD